MEEKKEIKYNSEAFVEAVLSRLSNRSLPSCRFCGGKKFTTTQNFSTLPIASDFSSMRLGPNIPAGMIICETCGHIDFFALGALKLLPVLDKRDKQ